MKERDITNDGFMAVSCIVYIVMFLYNFFLGGLLIEIVYDETTSIYFFFFSLLFITPIVAVIGQFILFIIEKIKIKLFKTIKLRILSFVFLILITVSQFIFLVYETINLI
ncbi:MAG: hypothetical protein LBM99_03390 [Bacillales bacterium]|jgi:hypothetical protein|nr:hypothetical protein [Bacillales bacterium]